MVILSIIILTILNLLLMLIIYIQLSYQYFAPKFHDCCDNKEGTVTIIKSHWGNIFGGYTSKSWEASYSGCKRDENAFLFLIKSDDESVQRKCPLLLELKEDHVDVATFCHYYYGPTFGSGTDILITDYCDKSIDDKLDFEEQSCNYSLLSSYTCDGVVSLCGGDLKTEWGTYFFEVIDYEVFQII